MKILRLRLENYKSIKAFDQTFQTTNILIGLNGSGKSSVLSIIAGLAGSDEASQLLVGQNVGFCELTVEHKGQELTFTAMEYFDAKEIGAFKRKLKQRVNYALSDYGHIFSHACCDYATVMERYLRVITPGDLPEGRLPVYYSGECRYANVGWGDGFRHIYSLISLDSLPGHPLLLDGPERHLHPQMQYRIMDELIDDDRQLFIATHSPEMTYKAVNMIDMSPS